MLRILVLLSCLGAFGFASNEVKALTISLVGDSTVCRYPENSRQHGWGELLPEFLAADVVVVNEAKGGASTKTFPEANWRRALSCKPDFVLIQFGHNDSHAKGRPEATDAATGFRNNLRRCVREARDAGARPILITPVRRRLFDHNGDPTTELQPYADAMKAVAAEMSVPVIDLHTLSGRLYRDLGEEGSTGFTMNQPDHADRPGKGDRTHFTEHGAREMAQLVARALKGLDPRLDVALRVPGP